MKSSISNKEAREGEWDRIEKMSSYSLCLRCANFEEKWCSKYKGMSLNQFKRKYKCKNYEPLKKSLERC